MAVICAMHLLWLKGIHGRMPKSKEYISDSESGSDDEPQQKKKKVAEKKPAAKPAKSSGASSQTNSGEQMFELGRMRYVNVTEFKGKKLVNIREFYNDASGDMKPGKKGIALTEEQWANLKKNISSIDKALAE